MSDKVTLANVGSLIDSTTAQTTINSNSAAIVAAIDNTLSLDGTAPNQMQSNLDMNSNHIVNLPAPINMSEPLRIQDVTLLNGGGTITVQGVPVAGTANQVLTKNSSANYDTSWKTPSFTLGAGQVTSTNVATNTLTNSNLTQTSGATFKGNPTSSVNTVQDFTIGSLTASGAPDVNNDYMVINDHVSGTLKKINTTAISNALIAGVSSIAGNTGAFTLGTGLTNVSNNILSTSITKLAVQKFTSSGTYTPTSGMVYCMIECVGGGGGAGGANSGSSNSSASGGGGAGSYARKLATAAQIGASQVVTIGTAGSGSSGAGGNTSVGSLCIANGGSGAASAGNNQATPGAAGGSGGTGDFVTVGMPGLPGTAGGITTMYTCGGNGGSSIFGGGGIAIPNVSSANGGNASGYGSGGAGGSANAGSTAGASAGFAGIVIITEFLNV